MRVECTATITDEKKKDALCTCIKIIGGSPEVRGDEVHAKYEGDTNTALKYVDLFERFNDHDIRTTISGEK